MGGTPTKPDPMSIMIDTVMALVETRRQGLNHDSRTSIVSISGGATGVNRSLKQLQPCVQLYFKTEYFTPEVFYPE